eukprot:5301498-Prymnesium_polylepis.1
MGCREDDASSRTSTIHPKVTFPFASARHALLTLSRTTVSEQRLGRRSGGQSVRASGRVASQPA